MRINVYFDNECISSHDESVQSYLENGDIFDYDENTKLIEFYRYLIKNSGIEFYSEEILSRDDQGKVVEEKGEAIEPSDEYVMDLFSIKYQDEFISTWNKDASFMELIEYLGFMDNITVLFKTSPGGKGQIDGLNCDGITFGFRLREANHKGRPHIHAAYQGDDITIDIRSLKRIAGSFKTKKYEDKAISYIEVRQDELLEKWERMIRGINPFND